MNINLSDHQKRILNEMLLLCKRYLSGEITLSSLVTQSEGLLDAGEFNDDEMREKWYDLWTPLETRRVVEYQQNSIEAIGEVNRFARFIENLVGTDNSG